MDEFSTNLQRATVAHLHLLCGMTGAREMYAKSYFSLGAVEKNIVDRTIFEMVAANYQALTVENMANPVPPQPVGFVSPAAQPKAGS